MLICDPSETAAEIDITKMHHLRSAVITGDEGRVHPVAPGLHIRVINNVPVSPAERANASQRGRCCMVRNYSITADARVCEQKRTASPPIP